MEIHSSSPWPAGALSNLASHAFVFDDVQIASMEGFLQSLKFDHMGEQLEVCTLTGVKAKNRGTVRREQWQSNQALWWRGITYDRHGEAYAALLDRAYQTMCDQNSDFRKALLDSGSSILTHQIGNSDPRQTILTVNEFCSRLTSMRLALQSALDHEPVTIDAATQASINSMKAALTAHLRPAIRKVI